VAAYIIRSVVVCVCVWCTVQNETEKNQKRRGKKRKKLSLVNFLNTGRLTVDEVQGFCDSRQNLYSL